MSHDTRPALVGQAPDDATAREGADDGCETEPMEEREPESFGRTVQRQVDRVGAGGPDGIEVPFDSFGDALRWWFTPLAERTTWTSFASLLAMAVIGPVLFALAVTITAVTSGLLFVLIGFLLIVPAFAAIAAFASVGRRLAGWAIDDPITPRPFAPARSTGLVGPITARLTDETRWRQLGYVLLDVVVAPLFVTVAFAPLSLVLSMLGSVGVGSVTSGPFDIGVDLSGLNLAFAIALLPLVARLMQLAGRLRHRYTSALIGPDREQVLTERVEELSVQRDQVLEAVAAERRRIERNLHDGVQQQLVALGIDIGRASRKLDDDPDAARELLDDAREKVRASIGELRLIGRGLHPAVLDDRGLDAALSSVVSNAPIPISVEVTPMLDPDGSRVELPSEIEETAYYLASEAVANLLKYSGARVASVRVAPDTGMLPAMRVTVHDDGTGGADERRGSGIAGMRARVEAVDGVFRLESPAGGPTIVTAVLPIRRTRHVGDTDTGTDAASDTDGAGGDHLPADVEADEPWAAPTASTATDTATEDPR